MYVTKAEITQEKQDFLTDDSHTHPVLFSAGWVDRYAGVKTRGVGAGVPDCEAAPSA